jgi:hypothetical protein
MRFKAADIRWGSLSPTDRGSHMAQIKPKWFCEGLMRGLLGQSSFFEQFGAIFLNFPQALEGRRFGLFKNALHP